MNWGWEPGNDKQGFVFFFQNITTTTVWWNVAEQMDTGFSTGKIMDFEYCEEYLRSN